MTVHICPLKDIECGDSRIRWCAACPKHKPVGMRGPVAFVPAFWRVSKDEPQTLDWSDVITSTTHDQRAKEAQAMTDQPKRAEHVRHFVKLGYSVRVEVYEYHANFSIYEIVGCDKKENPILWGASVDTIQSVMTEAPLFLHGDVKWDHCSNWEFNQEDCMLHFCSGEALVAVGEIMKACFDWAAELVPTWDKQ